MKKILLPFSALVLLISACKSGTAEGSDTQADSVTVKTAPTDSGNSGPVSPAANSGALNPEHGQPGHRCDIPVGQPLNSAPPKQPTITTTSNQPVVAPTISTTPVTTSPAGGTAAGLNPAHGQPGHRCDIPVGQPLNSAPGNTGGPAIKVN